MDSLTQIILGAAVGEAVAGKKLGNKAAFWGAIAGTIPDLDVFFRHFSHPIDGALLHRGFSHSIVFALLFSPILAWLINRLYKRRYDFKLLWKLFFLGIVTHPMLDVFTNYGTEFFWPFKLRWTFNSVFVIDPLYTIPFGLLLLIALFLKRESSLRRKLNYSGIIYSSLYLLWGVAVKLTILSHSTHYFKNQDIENSRTIVTPMPFTSFYWLILAENEDNFYFGYKSLFYSFDENETVIIPKHQELLDELKWSGKDYTEQLKFITQNYYSTEKKGDTLFCYDLRFGESSPFTNGQVETPFLGYGMVIDNGIVNKTFGTSPRRFWDKVNFDKYFERIFIKPTLK